MPLTISGFSEPCHVGVDLVLLDVPVSPGSPTTRTELVAASYADPSGADRTFLWRIDPIALQVESWGEVSPPQSADPARGMYATALAVDPYETNGGTIRRPGHVFLTTQIRRSGQASDPTTGPWAYLYRLDNNLVAAHPIEALPRAVITSLWCDQGDVFYGGLESASGNFRADTELFLRKNEGVTFNPGHPQRARPSGFSAGDVWSVHASAAGSCPWPPGARSALAGPDPAARRGQLSGSA